MKRTVLTSEWLSNWSPKRTTEIADGGCKGLLIRGGPSGTKTFYRWTDERDPASGAARRKRVKLGHWPALSLADAQAAIHNARETPAPGAADLTVAQLAEAYRRDVLSHREPRSLEWSWSIIRTHVLAAVPDPKRSPFGEWPARSVRAPEIAAVVRLARVERVANVPSRSGPVSRQLGGARVAAVALREMKALFAAAVGAGALEASPAAVLQAKALGLKGTKRARWLDANEMKALFAALDLNALLDGTAKGQKPSATVRLGIALLYYLPVRSHSLIGARWDEVDLEAARWIIPVERLKLHGDDRPEARPFTVPLPPTAVAILRRLKDLAGASPWVLAAPQNLEQHLGRKALIQALARLQSSGRLALGSGLTIHDSRRTWRAWAGELGVSFEVAEKSLAHVLPGVADTYARAEMVEQRAQAAELVAAAFDRVRLGKTAKVTPIAAAKGVGAAG